MNLVEFRSYIPSATLGDQQCLRESARLMAAFDTAPDVFAALDQTEICTIILDFLAKLAPGAKRPAMMERPAKLARDIQFAMARLHLRFKDGGFPFVPMPEIKRVSPLPVKLRPLSVHTVVEGWTPRIVGEKPGVGVGKPITAGTPPKYRNMLWQFGAIAEKRGAVFQENMTLAAFTSQPVLDIVMQDINQHFGDKTVPPFLTAIKRIVVDTLGRSHPNVGIFASTIKNYRAQQALPAKTIEDLRDLTDMETVRCGRLTVWEVPGAIGERAKAPGLRKADVDSRLACAVAVAISLQLLIADAEFLGTLNLDEAIQNSGNELELHWRDEQGRDRSVMLDEPARISIVELWSFRRRTGRSTPWLFPDRTRKAARPPSNSMAFVATNIEAVLGRRLTFVDLQDAVSVRAIDTGEADLNELSDARGAKYVKSTRSRFRVALNAPLNDKKRDRR